MSLQLKLFEYFDYKTKFFQAELGKLYDAIPFAELSREFVNQKSPKGKGEGSQNLQSKEGWV
jgi:hypothetical protein